MLQINTEDIEQSTEAEFEKILDILPQVAKITVLRDGEPVAVLMSVEEYERIQVLLSTIGAENDL